MSSLFEGGIGVNKGISNYREGDPVEKFLLIKSVKKAVASNGKPFLTLMLQDQSGSIEAKLWGASSEDEKAYTAEKIIMVTGDITSFRGQSQLRIKSARLAVAEDNVKTSDFIHAAPMSIEEMGDHITGYIFAMENPNIQRITRQIMKDHQEAFFSYPAAKKNHHEFFSGLAYHVVTMLDMADGLAKVYSSLNTDLLYAGVILHDFGKVFELSGAVTANYTFEGTLLGHISMTANLIAETATALDIEGEEVTLLQHMVLSHHGKAEWGSPKPPLLPEAEVLHTIDNLDARMAMMNRSLARTKPGAFTENIPALERRSLYKPAFTEE